jgi:hypothetical protein
MEKPWIVAFIHFFKEKQGFIWKYMRPNAYICCDKTFNEPYFSNYYGSRKY